MAVCFPNFGDHHRLPTNGFLQDCHWDLVASEQSGPLGWDPAPSVTLFTQSDEDTLRVWPHHFEAAYSVSLVLCHMINLFQTNTLASVKIVGL